RGGRQGGRSPGRHRLPREQAAHDVEPSLEVAAPVVDADAHRPVLVLAGDREREDEPSGRQRRQRPHLLGDEYGVPQGEEEERAERPVAPLGEETAEERRVLVVGDRRGVVVADEQAVEPGLPGGAGPLDDPAGAPPRVVDEERRSQRHADPHGGQPSDAGARLTWWRPGSSKLASRSARRSPPTRIASTAVASTTSSSCSPLRACSRSKGSPRIVAETPSAPSWPVPAATWWRGPAHPGPAPTSAPSWSSSPGRIGPGPVATSSP